MKKVRQIILLVGIVFSASLMAQPNFNWAAPQHGTSTTTDASTSYSIYQDAQGNIYTVGIFVGTVDFDPGPGVTAVTNSTSLDIYITKLNANGNLIWVKTIATNSSGLWAYKVIGDNQGGIYLTGIFQSTTDFNPGAGVFNLSSNGSSDAYVLKLDTAGTFQWAKSFGGSNFDRAKSLYFNSSNNELVIVGDFNGPVDFNPGGPVYNLTSNSTDAYVLSLDQSGNFNWAKQFTGTSAEYLEDIEGDANGNLFVTGYFYNNIDVDPSPSSNILNALGTNDAYISKLDASGNFIWATQLGGASSGAKNWGIDVSVNGEIYFAGDFNASLQFTDVNSNPISYTANGSIDIFVGSLNSTGGILWVEQFGGTGLDRPHDIASRGNTVYISGQYSAVVDFDSGPGTFNLPTGGTGTNACLFSLNNNGDFLWAYGIGNTDGGSLDNDELKGIVVSPTGEIYSTGYFRGSSSPVDLDPTGGVYNSTGAFDNHNSFTIKLGCTPSTSTDVVSVCNSFTWIDNNIYTANNTTATHRIPGGAFTGCDSVVTLNLTIKNSSTSTDVQTACGSYTWIDNNTYTSSNTTATHTLVGGNSVGCDSVVTLNLTINNVTTSTDVQTACGSYTWIDNNTYTSSNTTATHTLVGGNSVGCDSIVTLNLTINNADTSVTQASPMLTANATGATYQWLDCDNSFAIIAGATAQNYTATANGNYAVEVIENGCTDTSSCYSIVGIGIDEFRILNLSVYPNPTTGIVTIDLDKDQKDITIKVRNVFSQLVETRTYLSTSKIEFDLKGNNGVYFIEIQTKNADKTIIKVIKQ